jgi:hypothetical protein
MLTKNQIIIIIIFLILLILIINKDTVLSTFQNNTDDLDENGLIKNEIKPSYWYNYAPSEIRSKCFDCDATSKYKHSSNCIDCETNGGKPIDKLFNRVLSR